MWSGWSRFQGIGRLHGLNEWHPCVLSDVLMFPKVGNALGWRMLSQEQVASIQPTATLAERKTQPSAYSDRVMPYMKSFVRT